MDELAWKMRITVLWLIMAVGTSASWILFIVGPGVMEEIIAGEMEGMQISQGLLAVFALFWLISFIMAFLTLILKGSANRYPNAVLGLIFAIFLIIDIAGHLSRGEAFGGHCLMGVAGVIVGVLIFWHALKWPKLEAQIRSQS